MNGFTEQHLDDVHFEEPKSLSVKTFDAFPKVKATYLTRTRTGNSWTITLIIISSLLIFSETVRWFSGTVSHAFTVEKGVSHTLQMNLDIVVRMHCEDLHVNVQDATGDLIKAGDLLSKDQTNWKQWGRAHKLKETYDKNLYGEEDEDVHDYLGAARRGKRKFSKTPRLRGISDSCRIYGSMEENKVKGDFHITARGHGYISWENHLDHSLFNFTHHINELSFGPYYPKLVNPLDDTIASTDMHFYKFQYYASIVPTIYTTDVHHLQLSPNPKKAVEPLTNADPSSYGSHGSTIWTNQYAVTEQGREVAETTIPGIFFKYDIEPILLIVNEERGGFIALLVRLVNVISGVLVAGTWLLEFTDWAVEYYGKTGRDSGLGFLGSKHANRFV